MKYLLRYVLTFLLFTISLAALPCDMRQITTEDGLSNSAILSLYNDSKGFLWIGTCDGVNMYDGKTIYQGRQLPEFKGISGNIIENVIESQPGILWIQTNYGINKIIPSEGVLKNFPQYQGKEKIRISPSGDVFILTEKSGLAVYVEGQSDDFEEIIRLATPFSEIKEYVVTDAYIRFFTTGGVIDYPVRHDKKGAPFTLGRPAKVNDDRLTCAFADGETTLAVDADGNVLEYRPGDTHPSQLHNIKDQISRRGEVSDVLRDSNGNIFVSFATSGVIKLNISAERGYTVEDIGIDVGVFCLERSANQNIIWIGTDCHGVYTYTDGLYSIQSLRFSDFGNRISRPVRAIYLDEFHNLWIGTKGDGVLLVKNFNEANGRRHGEEQLFTTSDSSLPDNSVFGFSSSSRPVLWIATEGGIAYYSYSDRTIHRVDVGNQPLKSVYSVLEVNDSTLYATTIGYGVFKARITGPAGNPSLTDIRRYTIDNSNFSSNYFFFQTVDHSGRPVFCNRGFGAYTLQGDSLSRIAKLKNNYDSKTVYDVFAAIRDKDVIWLGTGHGLLKVLPNREQLFVGKESGFINNTIHAMLRDSDGNLWLSTNQGLIRFDPINEKSQVFARNFGLTVNEFSDGASFSSGKSLFFGGVDGIAIVAKNPDYRQSDKYMPVLTIISLKISGEEEPLSSFLSDGETKLSLGHDQNYFSVTFTAPDFLNSANYTYYYTLDGKSWINNGTSNTISFTRLDHGNYLLQVKYVNRETGAESEPYCLEINVAAPWYLSWWAKLIYLLIILGIGFYAWRAYLARQKEKQSRELEKMEQGHKEEVYEEKLRFFTNITHEFCTPLTLIFGSCERILANQDADEYMLKYIRLIRSNTERLNSLIQDLIDFRRIETGHKRRKIRTVSVSELGNDIFRSFDVIAEQNGVKFENEVQPDITFNTDYKSLLRIMSNLLSNGFKYTPSGGTVRLGMKLEGDELVVSVYNTGKGISQADREKIFNRYSILDNVEENATRGLSSRNGLGMAICSSLVEMLDGTITIDSEVGKYANFIVRLPRLEVTPGEETQESTTPEAVQQISTDLGEIAILSAKTDDRNRDTLLVIDDNVDILTLLSDSLSEYNVITASNAQEGLDILRNRRIDLIITDVMMPGTDGVTLTKMIKGNKHTMHIPLIILSAKNTNAEKVEGLASGADAYVAKPFHLSYLRALIVRLLENRIRMKEYYNSSASAFEYANGQLIDKESKEFVDRIVEYIDSNIDDSELSTEQIAKHMQVSLRNLYRKFKELELPAPNDFIKSHRIAFAAKLLVTTSLTVQEIIYRCGFNNRSHFYREFDKQYGMTPKDYRNANKTKESI